jgi:hypothetical protein
MQLATDLFETSLKKDDFDTAGELYRFLRSIVENEHGADEDAMSSSSTGMVSLVNIAEL